MNWRMCILFLAVMIGAMCPAVALCQDLTPAQAPQPQCTTQYPLPHILDSLRHYAQQRETMQNQYEANLRIKSQVDVLHKGFFPALVPYLNRAKLSEGSFTQQYTGTLKHTAQDSTTTTLTPLGKENSLIVREFTEHITSLAQNLNVHSQYIYGNIYSPLAYLSGKYYDFSLDSTWIHNGNTHYRIVFTPKINTYKFVEGYIITTQNDWSIRDMHIVGNMEFGQYCNIVQMGEQGSPQEHLPFQLQVKFKGNFLGTKINAESAHEFAYTRIGEHNFHPDSTFAPQPHQDTLSTSSTGQMKPQKGYFLVKSRSMNLNDKGLLYMAPLVSPLLFHYSTNSGLSYTQKLKYTRQLPKERMFSIAPLIGYNFKYKEFYWAVKGNWLYSPSTGGRIFIEAGNGVPQELRTSYAKLGHTINIMDNISITATAAQLHYTWHKKEAHPQEKTSYTTFAPEVELQYRKHGYPTFTLGYAHSLKGVFGSDVEFGRAEFDMQHQIDVGPMHTITYRAGFGIAFDYNYLYFVQFKNLKDNHLPHGWDDDIGGTFNLLSSVKYHEIDKYLRANIQYDAPLLLVPTLLRKVKYITKERLYCNLLLVDTMSPYLEMGYGIGTNIFNMGIFWGGEIDKWDRIGVKFTFEIFN